MFNARLFFFIYLKKKKLFFGGLVQFLKSNAKVRRRDWRARRKKWSDSNKKTKKTIERNKNWEKMDLCARTFLPLLSLFLFKNANILTLTSFINLRVCAMHAVLPFFNIRSDFNTFKLFVFVNSWMCVCARACVRACVSSFLYFILLSFAFSLAATHCFFSCWYAIYMYNIAVGAPCCLNFEKEAREDKHSHIRILLFLSCYSVHMNDGW